MNDDRDEMRLAERVAAAYRGTPAPAPSAREKLDQRLAREPAPRRGGFGLRGMLGPGIVTLRPAMAVAWAAGLLVLGIVIGRILPARHDRVALEGRAASSGERIVQFVLVAPGASRVAVVGDFNGWDAAATPMERQGDGATWTVHVAVPNGRHVYAFVTDGTRWITDPLAPLAPASDLGFPNSVIVVGEPSAS
jgi:hypothetical protein